MRLFSDQLGVAESAADDAETSTLGRAGGGAPDRRDRLSRRVPRGTPPQCMGGRDRRGADSIIGTTINHHTAPIGHLRHEQISSRLPSRLVSWRQRQNFAGSRVEFHCRQR